jgi:cytochrome c oxidase accessory protein FixG
MDQAAGLGREHRAVIEKVDVEPVNKPERRSLYKARQKIHPRRISGIFRRLKWVIMAVTLSIYYLAPWIRWDRGPNAPDQAILIDIPARRFYFFFIEIWPQEIYYLTGLLILAALALFLVTSIAGRVWCGYTCPQTVWTDLFIAVERWIEGDRNARILLDRAPISARKLAKRAAKHAVWLLIALVTGGAWVFYFADAPSLAARLLSFDAPPVAYISIAVLTASTYLLGGIAREQVCTYMCPWPRIQGAMLDEYSLVVTYHRERGEPRGSHKRGTSWEGRGACVDCNMCVAVCPMGIDIRDGDQLECITCALCIDACDTVMDRVGLPRGLIAYDTYAHLADAAEKPKILRPRVFIYGAGIALVGLLMLAGLLNRSTLDINVLHDRNPLFVTLADGRVRNGYTLKILNKLHEERRYSLAASGLDGAVITVVGSTPDTLVVKPDSLRAIRFYVAVPRASLSADTAPLTLMLRDGANGAMVRYTTVFRGPVR